MRIKLSKFAIMVISLVKFKRYEMPNDKDIVLDAEIFATYLDAHASTLFNKTLCKTLGKLLLGNIDDKK